MITTSCALNPPLHIFLFFPHFWLTSAVSIADITGNFFLKKKNVLQNEDVDSGDNKLLTLWNPNHNYFSLLESICLTFSVVVETSSFCFFTDSSLCC